MPTPKVIECGTPIDGVSDGPVGDLGSVERGNRADLAVLGGDPRRIGVAPEVEAVYKGGERRAA